jgi:hypothetical protein
VGLSKDDYHTLVNAPPDYERNSNDGFELEKIQGLFPEYNSQLE